MMAATYVMGLHANSNRNPTRNKDALENENGKGIEHSHGKSWNRGRMIGRGGGGSVYMVEPIILFGFLSRMVVKSAPIIHSLSIQLEKRAFFALKGCPNLVRYFGDEITETRSGEKIYNLFIEYCSGGSLYDLIKKSKNGLPEAEVISYARDIARGLEFMHNSGYAHCDIKPENILLVPKSISSSAKDKYVAKIADLGLALRVTDGGDNRHTRRGTLQYFAPEMVRDVKIDLPVDIWSFGCTVLEMLTGKQAWGSKLMKKNRQEVLDYIAYSYETPKIPDYISKEAKDFLNKCFDPFCGFNRWPASKLLKHPFLSESITSRFSRCCAI